MKSWIDRTSTQPTAGGLELGTGTGPYGDCRSNQCCMAVWSRWLESATRRVGFEALKKTLEALYTTKVNNRVHTSRGTTRRRAAAPRPGAWGCWDDSDTPSPGHLVTYWYM